MIKSLVATVALAISLAGCAATGEATREPGPSPQRQNAPSYDADGVYWSTAGGNPVHYAQTTGYYAGR